MASLSSSTFVSLILLSLAQLTAGASTDLISPASLENRFLENTLEQVRNSAGKADLNAELPAFEEAMQPMWLEAEKNENHRLNNAEVLSAMDALFIQRRGWHLGGMHQMASEPSPAGLSREQVPSFLLGLFEEIFGQEGLELHELALLAATLEQTIDQDPLTVDAWLKKEKAAMAEAMFDLPQGETSASWTWPIALAVLGLASIDATRRFCGWKIGAEKARPE